MTARKRLCVVTGAASGIGRACRAVLEAGGADVIGIDLASSDIEADLSTRQGCDRAVTEVEARSGGVVDAVVTAAGLSHGPHVVAVNYFGTVRTLTGLRPLLARSEKPRAVAIASIAAAREPDAALVRHCLADEEEAASAMAARLRYDAVYTSTKVALVRWLRATAIGKDWAGCGITLNAVAPGVIETPLMAQALADEATRDRLVRENPMPLHWPGQPEEIAHPVSWLASPECSFVTGQVLFVDGGYEANLRTQSERLGGSQR